MIAEEKRKAVLVAIEQVQDEEIFNKIAATVQEMLNQHRLPESPPRQQLAPPGFAAGEGFWMADDFDEPLEDMMPYM